MVKSKEAGAAVIIPHPTLPLSGVSIDTLEKKSGLYHGIEVFNFCVPFAMEFVLNINSKARVFGNNHPELSLTCGTDNADGQVGLGYCLTETKIESEEDLKNVIKSGGFIPGNLFFTQGVGFLNGLYHNFLSNLKLVYSIAIGRHS